MSFKNEDPLAGLERDLRANRPQLDHAVGDQIVAGIPSASRAGGIRMLTATVLATGVFGAMAMFGGMSYAIASVHHVVGGGNSTPADNQYGCPSTSQNRTTTATSTPTAIPAARAVARAATISPVPRRGSRKPKGRTQERPPARWLLLRATFPSIPVAPLPDLQLANPPELAAAP